MPMLLATLAGLHAGNPAIAANAPPRGPELPSAPFAKRLATPVLRFDDYRLPRIEPGALLTPKGMVDVELRWAANTQRPLHPSAGTDIDRAIEVGPPTAYLYLDAARIYSRLEKEGGKHRERIIRYLSESLRLGLNPDIIRREFKSLLENPALALLLTDPGPGTETARRTSRLADPLPDDFVLLHAPSARPDRPLERSD